MKFLKKAVAVFILTVLVVTGVIAGPENEEKIFAGNKDITDNEAVSNYSDNLTKEAAYIVYVSCDGDENAAGTIDEPFSTIEQARDYLRTKDIDENNRGLVYIREGVYQVSGDNPTVELNEEDSYVTFSAYPGEKVEITGTTTLDNDKFVKVTEAAGEQFSSKVRIQTGMEDNIYAYDLGSEGVPVGEILKNGFNWPKQNFQPELIVDGELQVLARYPDGSTVMTQTQILCGKTKDGKNEDETAKAAGANEGERPRNYWFDKTDNPLSYEEMLALKGPVFYARAGLEERISLWAPPTVEGEPQNNQPDIHVNTDNTRYETDGWLSGYFENNYANDMVRIYSVDMNSNTVHCKYPSLQGVQDKRIQLNAINMLCELDTSGEYYIDRYNGNNVLYYYPSNENIVDEKIQLTSSSEPFFTLEGAREIEIRNIIMDGTTGYGITMKDCEFCKVISCELYNISMDAIKIGENNMKVTADPSYEISGGGHNNIVSNCKIHDMGCGGVFAAGGDEQTLERGNNIVEHCEIYNISRLQTYTPAVYMEGVGNIARYNYIHDAPHMVIQIMGNDMQVTHNHIENVCKNTSDQAAIYSGRCFNWLGNEISSNLFENIKSGCYAIYMDDGMSGMIIRNNIFINMKGAAIFSNSGFGHQITDNIFINSAKTVSYKRYTSTVRPIANEKVLTYRYYRVLREGDGSNYTNTKENIQKWYEHYSNLYPYLSEKYLAVEDDSYWDTDENSLFVPSYQELNHMVIVGKSTSTDISAVAGLQDEYFNTDNFKPDNTDEIALDLSTGKIGSGSSLYSEAAFGENWVNKWNEAFWMEGIGIVDDSELDYSNVPQISPLPYKTPKPSSEPQTPSNTPAVSSVPGLKGDLNGDGKVSLEDAVLTLKGALGITGFDLEKESVADVDDDGKVTLSDACLVLQVAIGIPV